ncbi:MAG: adenosine kinase [Rikenellaceae bacterium]
MRRILAIGNALIDSIVELNDDSILEQLGLAKGSMSLVNSEQFEQLRGLIEGLPIHSSIAGSANNCIRAAARLGSQTGYIGKVGQDEMGSMYALHLSNYGVTTHLTHSDNLSTGQCIALVSKGGERTMVTYLGAASTLTPEDIDVSIFEGYDILFIEGYLVQSHDLMRHLFAAARNCGVEIAIDLASFNVVEASMDILSELLNDGVKIIFANEAEAEVFTSIPEPQKGAVELSKYCDIAVVKIGKEGSLVYANGNLIEVEATSDIAIDTTGAGDFYAGGFLHGYASGMSLERAAAIGSTMGGAVTTIFGTNPTEQMWDRITCL